MLNLIMANLLYIVVAVVILVVLFILWKLGKKDIIKLIIYKLVCEAEIQFGSKTGQAKLGYVWGAIVAKYPLLTIFISQKKISDWIEQACKTLKINIAKNNDYLLNYIQEQSTLEEQINPTASDTAVQSEIIPPTSEAATGATANLQ